MALQREMPDKELQRQFWNQWNAGYRLAEDPYMERQREVALEWVRRVRPGVSRILEVGCGTGWLCAALREHGSVTGIDLSPASIAEARRRYPGIAFADGDFEEMALEPGYDFIVSVDVLSHVADQQRFIDRIAALLRPGGLFVLMTQNPFVWRRSSDLAPQAPGQIRNWPSLGRVRELLRPGFLIRDVTSVVPHGDRGLLRITNSGWLTLWARRLLGRNLSRALFERLMLGMDFVVVSQRRGAQEK